ncbi:MAG: alpha-L-fucosidase [Fluviicola sp.]|nr:alpha-L-fucosidase [Fluviicola sp.]
MKIRLALLAIQFICISSFAQTKSYFQDSSAHIRERIEEWQDLKFGLLMHWGPYSQWGIVESWSICPEDLSWATGGRKKGVSETYDGYVEAYENLQTTFNPTKFNPEQWSKAAKNAGMKYLVFTTKHHDGFCMFDSKLTDYKITDEKTPFHTNPKSNITKELFSAFRKDDFWIGAYFSKPDWHSNAYWWDYFPVADRNCNYAISKYPQKWKEFVDYTHGQVDELMSDYGKIDILWLDGGWVKPTDSLEIVGDLTEVYEGSRWARNPQSQDINMPLLVKNARAKQPDLIVVDRAVKGPYQNYLTPEQHIPETGLPYPWETCMTMATSWSYVPNDTYKSSDVLITNLVDVVSKGGNFLLNIGPAPDGTLDSVAYARLNDIGRWMDNNSQAIYNTRMYQVFGEANGIRYTKSKDLPTLFVFIPESPSGKVVLEHVPFSASINAFFLGNNKAIKTSDSNGKLVLHFPKNTSKMGEYVWVVRLEL